MKKFLWVAALAVLAGVFAYGAVTRVGSGTGQISTKVLSDPSELFVSEADAQIFKGCRAGTACSCTDDGFGNVTCDTSACHANQYCPNNGQVGVYCCASAVHHKGK